ALRASSVDVAIEREPAPEAGISALPVLVEHFIAAVPKEHALADQPAIAVASLRDQPFVLFPPEIAPGLYEQVIGICRRAHFEPRVVQEAEEWQTILSLVEAGMGISLIPSSLQGRRGGAIAYLPLTGRPARTTTAACYRRSGRSRALDAFLEV